MFNEYKPRHDDFPNDYPDGLYDELSFRDEFKDVSRNWAKFLWGADRKRATGRI